MGNSLGGKKTAKVMKVNGETIKFKTPVVVAEVVKDYPGYVLLESEAVKHFGIRSKPLELYQELKPKRLYFLVELPNFPQDKGARRVRSGINMSAKDRLDSLMLARRSVSDLSLMKAPSITVEENKGRLGESNDPTRVKLRLPKVEVERLMAESKDETEAAERLLRLCMGNGGGGGGGGANAKGKAQVHWDEGGHGRVRHGLKAREKRVNFLPIYEREIQLAVA